ncbi:MAG: DUF6142 family protein [Butyrivibrio sp.]|nr:DUF6142 family protein [Butyrivibrio sp.]
MFFGNFRLNFRPRLNPPKLPKLPKFGRERYMFTDNKHPARGIMSSILGVISVFAIILAAVLTFYNGGIAKPNYAMAVILAGIYSVAGLVLGIISRLEKDIYKFFPNLGIFLNVVAILCVACVIYLATI